MCLYFLTLCNMYGMCTGYVILYVTCDMYVKHIQYAYEPIYNMSSSFLIKLPGTVPGSASESSLLLSIACIASM